MEMKIFLELFAKITVTTTTPVTLLQDSFTDTNGTGLAAHTMTVGPGWTVYSGGPTIATNKFNEATTSAVVRAASDAGQADVTAQIVVTLPAVGDFAHGMSLRLVDDSNQLAAFLSAAGKYRLSKFVAGVETVLQDFTPTFAAGETHTLKVVLSGTSVSLYFDGVLQGTVTTAQFQTATKFGTFVYNELGHGPAIMDDFLVTT